MALRRELNEINIPSPKRYFINYRFLFLSDSKRNHLLDPENYMVPDSPEKDGDRQRMNDKIRKYAFNS